MTCRRIPCCGGPAFVCRGHMADIAFGPKPGQRPDLSDTRTACMEMVRRKRMYGGILLVLFIGLMALGRMLADDRNAGGFGNGLPQTIDFPA